MTADELLEDAVAPAAALVAAVRDDPTDVHRILKGRNETDLHALAIVLACMVPDDRSIADLLAWTHGFASEFESEDRRRAAHTAYKRGSRTPWAVQGEKAYHAARYLRRKAARGAS